MEFDLRAGLAVRACPLRSGSKVKEAFADSSGKSPVEGQIFTFFTIYCSFYRCFTRKVAGRKKLYFERCFLLFQRNMFFFGNFSYDAWKCEEGCALLPQMILLYGL